MFQWTLGHKYRYDSYAYTEVVIPDVLATEAILGMDFVVALCVGKHCSNIDFAAVGSATAPSVVPHLTKVVAQLLPLIVLDVSHRF